MPYIPPEEKQRIYHEILANCDRIGDCLVYRGYKNPAGYGSKKVNGRTHNASRVVLAFATGEALNTRADACHKKDCLSKACCNPDHLCWGSHSANSTDREQAKRDLQEL